jgi:hypothetical protein
VGTAALLVLLASLAVAAWWRARGRASRQRRLRQLCWRAGLSFAPLDPWPDTTWLAHPLFAHARQGAENVVWGEHDDDVRVFDLWYEESTDDASRPTRRWATCAAVRIAVGGPRLRVVPRSIEGLPGVLDEEIRLELEEFDRRFRVECPDRRFAFTFLDQRMMEALLALPSDVTLDVDEDTLVLGRRSSRPSASCCCSRPPVPSSGTSRASSASCIRRNPIAGRTRHGGCRAGGAPSRRPARRGDVTEPGRPLRRTALSMSRSETAVR